MSVFRLTALLGLSATAFAQTTQVTWASVVYNFYGEKVPSLTTGPYNLTPLGANQSLAAGQLIRKRYVDTSGNASQLTTANPINGIASAYIDNTQLSALSVDDEFVSSSALAFFQGLYPPTGMPAIVSESVMSDKSILYYPLEGYQYPNIETVSSYDFNYIWIAGNLGCTNYAIAKIEGINSPANFARIAATQSFYDSLSSVFAPLDIDPTQLNYANAWLLWEYASYQYNHNASAPISASDLAQLYTLASEAEFELNTPNSVGTIASIAGQTFASVVLQQFSQVIASSGVSDKLTVLFGSYEPMLSFFALSNLSTGPSASLFQSLPQHGSSMVFELFSNVASDSIYNSSAPFPDTSELMVRFLFRNGTSDLHPLIEYSLFGYGNSENDLSWAQFVDGMAEFSLSDVVDWCSQCNSITLFCEALESNMSNSTDSVTCPSHKKELSPAVGGVIGATVTLALLLLLVGILALCGFRLEYRKKSADEAGLGVLKRSGSGNGGFKGAEKLASDTDLRLKGGAGASVVRHERVGSWELGEGPGSLDKDVESGRMERVASGADYGRRGSEDEGVNPFGDPVKPVHHV